MTWRRNWPRGDIRLDVLGFDVVATNAAEEESLSGLKQLAQSSRGNFYFISNPDRLIEVLDKSLQPDKYEVIERAQDRRNEVLASKPLGSPCELSRVTRKTDYVVRLLDSERPAESQVAVEGGEALQLWVQDEPGRPRRLVGHRYEGKNQRAARDKVPDPSDPQGKSYYLAADLPEWQGTAMSFSVSIQNALPERFCPRPAETWVEIQPVLPNPSAAAPLYVFFDRDFMPASRSPVLSMVAPNWPPEAVSAKIQLWFRMTKTRPDKTISVADFRRQQKIQLENVPGVVLELETKRGTKPDDPYRLIVTERHPVSAALNTMKVELDPMPKKVVRRYNTETGTVHHIFFLDAAEVARIGTILVLLTSKKRLAERAVTLPEPLGVSLPVPAFGRSRILRTNKDRQISTCCIVAFRSAEVGRPSVAFRSAKLPRPVFPRSEGRRFSHSPSEHGLRDHGAAIGAVVEKNSTAKTFACPVDRDRP